MSTTGHETEAINVRGLKASLKKGGNIGIFNECVCSTAGGTAAKVTNTVPPSFSLVSGAKIIVKFTYAITVANATLQVGETAAKPIRIMGAALDANVIKAGTSVLLSYDGTAYNIIGGVGGNDVDVNYDTTNKKITKTINGVTSDVVTAATIVEDGGGIEVEIGETAPIGTPKLFVDEDADPAVSIDVYTMAQTDTMLAAKADKSTTYTKTEVDTSLAAKVDKVTGKGLSTNDYTTDEKNKLAGIAAGAEVNVQSDWDATSGDAFIKNKPTIPEAANNGTYTVKTLVGSTTTNVSDFTANQSGTDDVTFVQGSNVTITPDATNRKITIAATDTTYSSEAAASGGTDVSLVTTGEKYIWNNLRVPKISVADYTTAGANYTIFASVSSSSTSRYKDCTVLVSGAGYYYGGNYTGTWLVEMRSSNGGTPRMRVTCLAEPNSSSTITFGYYTDSTAAKTYFGVKSTSRRGEFNVTTLVNNSGLFTIEAQTVVTAAPEGWTEVTTGTEQSTINATDYVVLKDTNGVNRKISKANMMSVVKDALADLLKSNDLGTSVTNVPALGASAFGSATMANLASVLGGIGTDGTTTFSNPNLDQANRGGFYANGQDLLCVISDDNSNWRAQLVVSVNYLGEADEIVVRGSKDSGSTWGSWRRVVKFTNNY